MEFSVWKHKIKPFKGLWSGQFLTPRRRIIINAKGIEQDKGTWKGNKKKVKLTWAYWECVSLKQSYIKNILQTLERQIILTSIASIGLLGQFGIKFEMSKFLLELTKYFINSNQNIQILDRYLNEFSASSYEFNFKASVSYYKLKRKTAYLGAVPSNMPPWAGRT